MKIGCIIPARFGSTRLPGKPLKDIMGKPMIQRVYERVQEAKRPDVVIVATDDERVYEAVKAFGGEVMMTSSNHLTGTDRLAEVAKAHAELDVIINVQGDEPLMDAALIDALAYYFESPNHGPMVTASSPLLEEEYDNPASVKVVTKCNGDALYFSRSCIPYRRNDVVVPRKHVGIYGYEREFLLTYATMEPTPLELTESLEQLRALENGYTIHVIPTEHNFVGVDTQEDLERVREIFAVEGK